MQSLFRDAGVSRCLVRSTCSQNRCLRDCTIMLPAQLIYVIGLAKLQLQRLAFALPVSAVGTQHLDVGIGIRV